MSRLAAALVAALTASACSSADTASAPTPVEDSELSDDAPAAEETASDAPATPHLRIEFDYRFDSRGYFRDPTRKQALEGAAAMWSKLLTDTFPNVPAGTFIKVRNPEKPTEPALSLDIDYEIDDVVIFVGSADLADPNTASSSPTAGLSEVTDAKLGKALYERFHGDAFQPWTAWITFDASTSFYFDPEPEKGNPIPAGSYDFVSVAMHEIGHVLGFGTSDAFKSKITGGAFTGAKATALFGGPLPLTTDLAHVPNTTMSDGVRLLMDQSDAKATRYTPTSLDRAVFEDLGFHF